MNKVSKEPVECQHFDDTGPEQNTGRKTVENTEHPDGGLASRAVVDVDDTETNGHSDGGDENEENAHEELGEQLGVDETGDSGSQTDSLKHLVEQNGNEERGEVGVGGQHKSDTNKNGMEDDTGLHDHDRDLIGRIDETVTSMAASDFSGVVVSVGVSVSVGMSSSGGSSSGRRRDMKGVLGDLRTRLLEIGVGVRMRMSTVGSAMGSNEMVRSLFEQLGECVFKDKSQEETCQNKSRSGGLVGHFSETGVVHELQHGTKHEMDDGCGNDDSGSKLFEESHGQRFDGHLEQRVHQDRREDSQSRHSQHGKQSSNSVLDVEVSVGGFTSFGQFGGLGSFLSSGLFLGSLFRTMIMSLVAMVVASVVIMGMVVFFLFLFLFVAMGHRMVSVSLDEVESEGVGRVDSNSDRSSSSDQQSNSDM